MEPKGLYRNVMLMSNTIPQNLLNKENNFFMSFFHITTRPSDKLNTEYIRLRDKDTCFWCGRKCDNKQGSGVSHYHSRGKESTRHDDDNCDLMHNIPCHEQAEHQKQIKGISGAKEDGDYTIRKRKQLGIKSFDMLLLRANTLKSRDDELDKIILKEKIKRINDAR